MIQPQRGAPSATLDVPLTLGPPPDPQAGKSRKKSPKKVSFACANPTEIIPRSQITSAQAKFAVLPRATYELKTGTTAIRVRMQHPESVHQISQDNFNSYVIEPNLFLPGVVVLQTAMSG